MKKGRHRRFEEARALKRSQDVDLNDLFEDISGGSDEGEYKPEHDAWADLAEEWDSKNGSGSASSVDDETGEDLADDADAAGEAE